MKLRKFAIMMLSLLLLAAVTACQKRDTLAGTTWVCDQDGSEMIFVDDFAGNYLWTADGPTETYSLIYEYSHETISITIAFPRRTFEMSGTIVDGCIMTLGGKATTLTYNKKP